jgi:hypothetical protein
MIYMGGCWLIQKKLIQDNFILQLLTLENY